MKCTKHLLSCCNTCTGDNSCGWKPGTESAWGGSLKSTPFVDGHSVVAHTHTHSVHTHIACTHTVYTHSTHTHTHTCRASFLLGIWAIIDKVCNNVHDKVSVHYAGYTTSTASHLPLVVTPPITTSVSPGRVATRHSYRPVGMCSKMCQESIDGL